jgi:PAS domain S-box-containing protein
MVAFLEREPIRLQRFYPRAFPSEALWTADAAGDIVADCPSWREFTGQTLEEILGSGWLDAVHPEERERVEKQWSQAVAAGSIFETDFRVRRADGKWRHMTVRGVPVLEKNGIIGNWGGYCRDVTDQVDYTELLFRERNFSNALIECLPGIFYVTEESGKMLRWNRNAEVISGYSAEDFSQMLSIELLASEYRDAIAAARKRLIKADGYEEMEVEYLTKSGERIPFWINGKRVIFNGKRCVIGVGVDISKLKNTEERLRELNVELEDRVKERTKQLERSNRELEAFSYTVSHDLRAPLHAIHGFAEALKEDYGAAIAGEGEQFVEHILQAGERMSHLIEDVLRYSRTGRAGVKLHEVPVAQVVHQVRGDFELRLNEIGGRLEIAENLPEVSGEPTLLVQVFTNLFQNAINYRRRDVPLIVKVDSFREAGDVVLSVADNGIGIAPANWEKVFQAFHRLHTDKEHPGTGLGLATVKKAVEVMGGTVWVESDLGLGTTFFIRLKAIT